MNEDTNHDDRESHCKDRTENNDGNNQTSFRYINDILGSSLDTHDGNNPDENLEAGSSNLSHRTNLSATETPIELASEMARIAKVRIHDRVLEPSAGYGPLAFAARSMGAEVTCIELNEICFNHLVTAGWYKNVIRTDFLKWNGEGFPLFDAILMCPPRNSIPHIEHALTFLKSDGRLVALVRRDSNNIEKYIDNYHSLPDTMFQIDGKHIEAGLIVI